MRDKLEMPKNFYLENIKGRDHVKDLESFKMSLKEKIGVGFEKHSFGSGYQKTHVDRIMSLQIPKGRRISVSIE